jgi:radical SAM superfamily enzyme YgiQ (UPF0313 family)
MMEAIAPYAKPTEQKNLTPIYIDYKTRNTKLVLVLCPEWSPYMPPFSLARLSGVAKSAGYETHIFDLNVLAYKQYRDDWSPNNKIPFRLWDPSASWRWLGETYHRDVHPLLEPLLNEHVDKILALNPDVVGFSIYYISEEPTKWMVRRIKQLAPHIKIAVGGPNAHKSWFEAIPEYDYIVVGEGEYNLLVLLDEVEEKKQVEYPRILKQPEDERLNLNGLPMPDYESIDFSMYDLPNGVNSEISRGCTAKCSFCEETHFWKYRQRQAVDLVTEVEWLYYNKGTDVIWFIDSLVNGNLKELRAFALALKAKNLKVKWTGYARCDGRMTYEYLKDLADGGCIMFNFGVESGSQHVLDDMHKGVTIQEMEQNFIDCKKVGIWAATNWIIGFPTEKFQDFADTISFLWRMKDNNINNIGAGVGFAQGPETITGQNPHRFNLSFQKYLTHWITKDLDMGGTHVMIRVKSFHIFLDLIQGTSLNSFSYPVRYNLAKEHYKINLHDKTDIRQIDYEKFDYDIIKPGINPYADTMVNEMWVFFRMLWRCRGGYDATILFNPEIDEREFGSTYGPHGLTAIFNFSINREGQWTADFDIKFVQLLNPDDKYKHNEQVRMGPFLAIDFSRLQSNTARRARKLAKPTWSLEEGRSGDDFSKLLNEEIELNAKTDFSFEYKFNGSGDWSNHLDFAIDVPNQSSMPAQPEEVYTIPLTSIKRHEK